MVNALSKIELARKKGKPRSWAEAVRLSIKKWKTLKFEGREKLSIFSPLSCSMCRKAGFRCGECLFYKEFGYAQYGLSLSCSPLGCQHWTVWIRKVENREDFDLVRDAVIGMLMYLEEKYEWE